MPPQVKEDVLEFASTSDLDERALLVRLASGDEGALLMIYRRHSRRIFSLILRILGSEPEAEEVRRCYCFYRRGLGLACEDYLAVISRFDHRHGLC